MMNNELMHYGVLGMKWGIHRAAKRGETYSYRSLEQRYKQRQYNKAVAKGKPTTVKEHRLNVVKQRDRNREEFARSTSLGANLARNLLMTPWGNGSYNRMRAGGASVLKSFVTGMYSTVLPITGALESRKRESDLSIQTAYMGGKKK